MIDLNLAEELAEQVIDRLIPNGHAGPQPVVKEDREDNSAHYVRNILVPTQRQHEQELDRDD